MSQWKALCNHKESLGHYTSGEGKRLIAPSEPGEFLILKSFPHPRNTDRAIHIEKLHGFFERGKIRDWAVSLLSAKCK